jgi:enoyl-CoA hydratase/carnithine racemase
VTYTCFKLDALTPSLWRTTFNNPPINLIDVRMIAELRELFVRVERDEGPAVLIFESADPDYFLAHFDISPANLTELASLSPGPTGLHPWLDILVA